jgi:hypothetical protein
MLSCGQEKCNRFYGNTRFFPFLLTRPVRAK